MFLNKSQRSRRKKKAKTTSHMDRSTRKKKGSLKKKKERSERAPRKKTPKKDGGEATLNTIGDSEGPSKFEKEKPKKVEVPKWGGEEVVKKMVAAGFFAPDAPNSVFKDLPATKPNVDDCPKFKANLAKCRAPEFPIPDEKLVKLSHAPENFICAAKITVPEFNRTMLIAQVPDVTQPSGPSIEDFWRMIFQEEIVCVIIAVMPLEGSVTLQQLFPISTGSFSNHGKMFLNNKKVESAVAMTAYTLEILPDGCSNSINTTVYHLHNWKQKKGLDNVGELVTTVDKAVKTNENTALISLNGTGRAGAILTLFASMLQLNKEKELKMRELVEKLRQERSGIVENSEQMVTVYKALSTWIRGKVADEELGKKLDGVMK